MSDETKDLEFVQPRTVVLVIDGVELAISPLVLRDLPNVIAQALPIFAQLKQEGPEYFERFRDGKLTDAELQSLVVSVIASGENYIALLALLARKPADWVGGLLPDRVVKLMFTCLEVNADFFRMARPVLAKLAADAAARAKSHDTSATPTASSS